MTPEELKEWENSEVSKRIGSTEQFAILRGYPEWDKPTIIDFINSLLLSRQNKLVEEMEKNKTIPLEIPVIIGFNQGLDKAIEIIKNNDL